MARPARKTATRPRSAKPKRRAPRRFGVRAIATGIAALGLGAAIAGLFLRRPAVREGHAAPDLAPDRPRPDAQTRAPEAFRPDPTAPLSDADRAALRG